MKVCVFGAGCVGLVTAACLSAMGNSVRCLDIDPARAAALQQGHMPIHEPGRREMVLRNAAAGRLHFTEDTAAAVAHGTIVFIAVGTPAAEDGSADLAHVLDAARAIGRHMLDYKVVVDKSTVPMGTAEAVRIAIAAELRTRAALVPFAVVSNPEFLKEGDAIEDFMRPDRVIVGANADVPLQTLQAVQDVNARQRGLLVQRPAQRLGEQLHGHVIGLWGLAFKPGTDDLREAPSLAIIGDLLRRGATVRAFDPVAMPGVATRFAERAGLELVAEPLAA